MGKFGVGRLDGLRRSSVLKQITAGMAEVLRPSIGPQTLGGRERGSPSLSQS